MVSVYLWVIFRFDFNGFSSRICTSTSISLVRSSHTTTNFLNITSPHDETPIYIVTRYASGSFLYNCSGFSSRNHKTILISTIPVGKPSWYLRSQFPILTPTPIFKISQLSIYVLNPYVSRGHLHCNTLTRPYMVLYSMSNCQYAKFPYVCTGHIVTPLRTSRFVFYEYSPICKVPIHRQGSHSYTLTQSNIQDLYFKGTHDDMQF